MRSGILMLAHIDGAAAMRRLGREITVISTDPAMTAAAGERVVEPIPGLPPSVLESMAAEYEPPAPMHGERPMNRAQRRAAARKKIK